MLFWWVVGVVGVVGAVGVVRVVSIVGVVGVAIQMLLARPCTTVVNKTHSFPPLQQNNDHPLCSPYKKSEMNPQKKQRLDSSAMVSWGPTCLFL